MLQVSIIPNSDVLVYGFRESLKVRDISSNLIYSFIQNFGKKKGSEYFIAHYFITVGAYVSDVRNKWPNSFTIYFNVFQLTYFMIQL